MGNLLFFEEKKQSTMVFEEGIAKAFYKYDDDEEAFLVLLFATARRKKRVKKWTYDRIDWGCHLQELRYTRKFQSRYHMSESSFNKLVCILTPKIGINELQSMRSTGGNDPITPEMTVGAGLRFLGGEYVKSIADIYGMSDKSAERIINNFLEAVDSNESIGVHLPDTPAKLKECADAWDGLSSAFGVYHGAVGAIDGWLCCIEKPKRQSNPTDYFSGHYQRYGLNIQAVCDANLRFIYISIKAPGRTNDARAYSRCLGLRRWVQSLPDEYYIIGDNAYTLTNKLLIPFSGAAKLQTYNRTYNFYLSQLRIRIEMAFGRLTTKWRIFRRNLDFHLEKTAMICRVAAILHNFVINNDNLDFSNSVELGEFGVDELEDGPNNNRGYLPTLPAQPANDGLNEVEGCRRNRIVSEIIERDMRRPTHNLRRNEELDEVSVYYGDE